MTISVTTTQVTYSGSGSTGPFAIPFYWPSTSELVVIKTASTGVETTLAVTTGYTATGAGTTTGSITLVTALASGETLLIRRRSSLLQDTNLIAGGKVDAEVLETRLDKIVCALQEIRADVEGDDVLRRNTSGATNYWDAESQIIRSVATPTLANDATTKNYVDTAISNAAFANIGSFTQNGAGAVTRTYLAKNRDIVSVKDFGAVGDGSTDDTAALQAALNSGAQRVYAPAGTYRTTAGLSIPSNVSFVGDGKGLTKINCNTSSVTAPGGIVKSAVVRFDGSCPGDDYGTYTSATGDYFTTGPKQFASSSTFAAGATSFTAANSSDVSGLVAGNWLYLSEGIPAWHPAKSEFVQVASVAGTTVNLRTRLRNSYANTTTSLGAFIRSYALTANPGGGGAGYPDMSTWADAGFRLVVPVVNSSVKDMTLMCNQSGSVSKIGWLAHLAIRCEIDVEIDGGSFWVVDCQDLRVSVTGGIPLSVSANSYLANGTNGVECNIDITGPLQIEEGAQNVSGVVRALGYSTIKQFAANVDVDFTCSAGSTPALEVSTVRDVIVRPRLFAAGSALNVITPLLSSIATDLPQAFLSGEVAQYYGCGLTTVGGECISSSNSTLSIRTTNGGQVRCIDTVVPVAQSSRYKGTQVVDGRIIIPSVTTAPLYDDLETGERFISTTLGEIAVTGLWTSTVSQQFNFGSGTLDTLIIDSLSSNNVQVGDIVVFRLSDSASAPVNWSWHVAEVTAVSASNQAIRYSPANPTARTAITASNEDRIFVFRINKRFAPPALIIARAGHDAQFGGNIPSVGTAVGGPIQLGTYHLWIDSNNMLRIKNGAPTSSLDGQTVDTMQPTATAASIAAVANAINTSGKYAGRLVWDTTNNRMMRASGAAAADVWYVIDGSASVTPS